MYLTLEGQIQGTLRTHRPLTSQGDPKVEEEIARRRKSLVVFLPQRFRSSNQTSTTVRILRTVTKRSYLQPTQTATEMKATLSCTLTMKVFSLCQCLRNPLLILKRQEIKILCRTGDSLMRDRKVLYKSHYRSMNLMFRLSHRFKETTIKWWLSLLMV